MHYFTNTSLPSLALHSFTLRLVWRQCSSNKSLVPSKKNSITQTSAQPIQKIQSCLTQFIKTVSLICILLLLVSFYTTHTAEPRPSLLYYTDDQYFWDTNSKHNKLEHYESKNLLNEMETGKMRK